MKRALWKFVGFLLVVAVVSGAVGAWWYFHSGRYRPQTITAHRPEIERALSQAGWVSPGLTGPQLYLISFRACPECIAYEAQEFPALQAAGVDTRVILFAPPDREGIEQSTVFERSTVAELWLSQHRDWPLFQRWMGTRPPSAWTAPGVTPADGDAARTGVVTASRAFVAQITPWLRANSIPEAYPTIIWRTRDGALHGCACTRPEQWANIREELGVAQR